MLETATHAPARPTAAERRFAVFAWFVLAHNIGVVLWGAYVRASRASVGI